MDMGEARVLGKLKQKARQIKLHLFVLWLAYKDPRVPWYAKWFAALVLAYAFSPIDLIPDFIPVLGYVDDLILVPLGIVLALKMIPEPVLEECKEKAEEIRRHGKPKNWWTGALFLCVWALVLLWIGKYGYSLFFAR